MNGGVVSSSILPANFNKGALWVSSLEISQCNPQNGSICTTWNLSEIEIFHLHLTPADMTLGKWPFHLCFSLSPPDDSDIPLLREYRDYKGNPGKSRSELRKVLTKPFLLSLHPISWFQSTWTGGNATLWGGRNFLGRAHIPLSFEGSEALFCGTVRKGKKGPASQEGSQSGFSKNKLGKLKCWFIDLQISQTCWMGYPNKSLRESLPIRRLNGKLKLNQKLAESGRGDTIVLFKYFMASGYSA